jgi:hypothetical protein
VILPSLYCVRVQRSRPVLRLVRALVVGVIAATLCMGRPTPAFAQSKQDGVGPIAWQAPEGCPSSGDVQRELARLLGERRDAAVSARAVVTHGAAWTVTLETELAGRRGQRSIEAASCAALADATALIVALMVDPDAVLRARAAEVAPEERTPSGQPSETRAAAAPPATTPTSSPPAPPPSSLVSASLTAPVPASRAKRSVDFLVGGFAAGSYGVLPLLDAGMGLGLGVEGSWWRVELRGTYGLRRDQVASAAAPPGAYGRFEVSSANGLGCLRLQGTGHGTKVAFGPCVSVEAGLVSAEGHGTSETTSAATPWFAAGAGAFAAVPLGARVSVPLHVDALASFVRPDFVFRNVEGVVFRAPLLGLRATVGVEVHF